MRNILAKKMKINLYLSNDSFYYGNGITFYQLKF